MNHSFTERRSKSFFVSLFRKLHLLRYLSCGSRKKHCCFFYGNNFPGHLSSETHFSNCTKNSCLSDFSGQTQFSIEEDSCTGDHSGETQFSVEESAQDPCSGDHSDQTHLLQESSQDSCSGNLSGPAHFSMEKSVIHLFHVQVDESNRTATRPLEHHQVHGADHFESEQEEANWKMMNQTMMNQTAIRPLEPPYVDAIKSYSDFFHSCMESSPSPSSGTIARGFLLFSIIFFLGIFFTYELFRRFSSGTIP
ncbi:hypothetical protein AMTRI_Chr10g227890 [Amborella trichopoda]